MAMYGGEQKKNEKKMQRTERRLPIVDWEYHEGKERGRKDRGRKIKDKVKYQRKRRRKKRIWISDKIGQSMYGKDR